MEVQKVSTNSFQVVSFSLNLSNGQKEEYALPIEQVSEIRTIEEITQIPKAKSYVKGIMNLRGIIIPVIDVRKKLDFAENDNGKEKQRILVAEVNKTLYGLLVDSVDEVIRIPSQNVDLPPPGTFENHKYVKGIAKIDKKLLILLDIKSLIDDSEVDINKYTNTANMQQSGEKLIQNPEVQDDIPESLKEVLQEDTKTLSGSV